MSAPHVESLTAEWIPTEPVGRAGDVERVEALLAAAPQGSVPRAVVLAPPGSGGSLVARLAARRYSERFAAPGRRPRVLPVRVRCSRGSVGVATDLLRVFDPGFSGRGFSTAEIVAGFLRRMIREDRGAIVVLDDIGPAAADLSVILRALLAPDQFLPEGAPHLPPFAVLLSVHSTAKATLETLGNLGLLPDASIVLSAYSERELRAILADRAQRALGRPADPAWLDRLTARVRAEGGSAPRAIELLREYLVPPALCHRPSAPRSAPPAGGVEPRLLSALERACERGPADVRSVRRWERTFAATDRADPLPLTTLWRRLVRLEELGLLSRQVRPGGPGGTRSMIVLRSDLRTGSTTRPNPRTDRAPAVRADLSAALLWPPPEADPGPWLPLAGVAAAAAPIRRAPVS
jgi:hypothetical protein